MIKRYIGSHSEPEENSGRLGEFFQSIHGLLVHPTTMKPDARRVKQQVTLYL
jgi:hypothetical protein